MASTTYLRDHTPDSTRVHYAYLDAGGVAPNVVHAKVTVRQLIRAGTLPDLNDLVMCVRNIAYGTALMTETQTTSQVFSGVSKLLGNRPLEETMQLEFEKRGPVGFDDADLPIAREIQTTLTAADIDKTFKRIEAKPAVKNLALCDFIAPLDRQSEGGEVSTEVGVEYFLHGHLPFLAASHGADFSDEKLRRSTWNSPPEIRCLKHT